MKSPDKTINGLDAAGFVLLSAVLFSPSLSAAPLTASETRGKQLYLTGAGPSGKPVKALVGPESTELSGTDVPCAGCHGEDGHGRPEGGIVPTDITFEHLTLAYGHTHDNGRKHAAFTAGTIAAAIAGGLDPAGNRLDSAMPRYALSASDSADLIAYLKRLSTDADPGLSESVIRLGTVLPMRGPLAGMGQAMKDMLSAYFDEINARGGIYNREIRLEVAEFTGSADSTIENARRLLEAEPVFALIAPFAGNLEQDILLLSESRSVPQIGPYTLFPEENPVRSRSAFYLLPGLKNEARAMVDYAADALRLENAAPMVIGPKNAMVQGALEAIDKQSRARGLGPAGKFIYPQRQSQMFAAELKRRAPGVIFFFGTDDELRMLLKSAEQLKPKPYLFVSGSLTSPGMFNEAPGSRIFMSLSLAPPAQANADEFFRLIKRNNRSMHHLTAQAVSYSAAKLLAEGLQRTGRDLSRKKLINTLETIYQFDTGVIPLLSYGSNRHIGSTAVTIVSASRNER
ncbi:ABC transporter substrate-binding protein [Methylobacter sp. BlB1]|uniref:ABC transporter substrate-binding protein n=1 Tax=Methylobacter sp. BlB1 TaxID=2785914 RepID=UPI0018956E17|nr:ABC transporter substrate-binding protein [Methylobacter sp. BlB1]MBF6649668.1 ABC transporter substrate-binding protein [Methylobacter sp. BlB1]